jgi:hypothetical protein
LSTPGYERLVVDGSLNLNDRVNYFLLDFNPGVPERAESWIEPWSNDESVLSNYADRKCKMSIVLEVRGTSHAQLESNMDAARDAFSFRNALVEWSRVWPDVPIKTFRTWPSAIDNGYQADRSLFTARTHLFIPEWHLDVWRSPYPVGDRAQVTL